MATFDPDIPTGHLSITLTGCTVASVRANLLAGTAKITFAHPVDDEMMDAKRALSWLAAESTHIDLLITEQQMRLPLRDTDAPPE